MIKYIAFVFAIGWLLYFIFTEKINISEFIPSYKYPIIIDRDGQKTLSMRIVANEPDETGSYEYMILTREPLVVPILKAGRFSVMGIEGYSYYWRDVKECEQRKLLHIKKGTSKKFIEYFLEERIRQEEEKTHT